MKKNSIIIVLAIVGTLLAGWYAQNNRVSGSHTYQALFASMVNPPETLTSPRTYNQTLVETADLTDFQQLATNAGAAGVNQVKYDILPDSFHIQVSITYAGDLTDEAKTQLQTTMNDYLQERSDTLSNNLFAPETTIRPQIVFTKELPTQTNLGGNPLVAALYGLIAGALFGWFISLGSRK